MPVEWGGNARNIFSEAEVAVLIFWVQRHLPACWQKAQAQQRVQPGRATDAMGERMAQHATPARGRKYPKQLTQCWADIIDCELDLFGVKVEGLGE